ncbi:MAG: ketol-acid reductoisomerase [Verrucomicrobiota bacterium]|nr:ketol-acid reductoisomerase [Verrucomicrobiota bacterium]
MATKIFRDAQIRRDALRGKVCAVIGFGAQGHAHALNLRDSRHQVIVGLRRASRSRRLTRAHKLRTLEIPAAVRAADVIFLALPDTKMPAVFAALIAPHLRAGQTLLFAHGFSIVYRTLVPPRNVNVILVAPKGLGPMVRREYVAGRGVPALIAVERDVTGDARALALSWAKAIGGGRAGIIETTFREETETDLFGEQAVLCGGVTQLVRRGFDTLVRAGYAPELAYFECLHELKFVVDLMHETGVAGMTKLISDTAQWGELTAGPRIVDDRVGKNMEAALQRIRSGKFASEFIAEIARGGKKLKRATTELERSQLEVTGRRLRALMAWRKKR